MLLTANDRARRGPLIVSKLRTKTYVAILRCSIRNPTYLCSAQN